MNYLDYLDHLDLKGYLDYIEHLESTYGGTWLSQIDLIDWFSFWMLLLTLFRLATAFGESDDGENDLEDTAVVLETFGNVDETLNILLIEHTVLI